MNIEDSAKVRLSYFEKIGNSVDNIILIKNFINKEDLVQIQNYLNNLPDSDEEFYGPLDLKFERVARENHQVAHIIKKYEELTFNYIQINFVDKYDIPIKRDAVNYCHFVKWLPGMLSKLHADCEKPDGSPAVYAGFNQLNISTLVYINDNYVGGSIAFPDQSFSIKPDAGDLIIFPGNSAYRHEVTKVESGKRYTMPSWYTFDIDETLIAPQGIDRDSLLTNSKQLWDNNAGKVDI